MSEDPYVYPGTNTLINRLDITDPGELDRAERRFVERRMREGTPSGDFDLLHLRAIHRHLFQDVYAWAGEIRAVEISKGDSMFQFSRYIATGMEDVHRRVKERRHFTRLGPATFARAVAPIIGDVNYVHPFREGNGRTQLLYLEQLAARAGHELDLTRLHPSAWIAASKAAHNSDYAPMAACINETVL